MRGIAEGRLPSLRDYGRCERAARRAAFIVMKAADSIEQLGDVGGDPPRLVAGERLGAMPAH